MNKSVQNAKTALGDTFETLKEQILPIKDEATRELSSFFDPDILFRKPTEIAKKDLERARKEQQLKSDKLSDSEKSSHLAEKIVENFKNEYQVNLNKNQKQQKELDMEFDIVYQEIENLAKTNGIKTSITTESKPKKVGILDIKRLTGVVISLRKKVEKNNNASELLAQRSNAKRATGMEAWVSGKQMQVHEQGTLQLQG